MLLNVELPVMSPCPFRGAPLACQVCPSSVDFIVRMIELFCESCHEIHRGSPLVGDPLAIRAGGVEQRRGTPTRPGGVAGQRVTDTPIFKWVPFAVKMMSSPQAGSSRARDLDVASPSPRFTRPAPESAGSCP